MPLICGIYGWKMNLLGDLMYSGTSIPKCCDACQIARESFPAGSWRCGAREGFNDFALRRMAREGCEQERGADPPEILWSTWENRGPGTSPPLAVVLDKAWQRLVVVVRGTMVRMLSPILGPTRSSSTLSAGRMRRKGGRGRSMKSTACLSMVSFTIVPWTP
ncbi:unnamed protein product [Prorocentrum cordatum]|uniref:Uncharacterized protein n=1 Tax=Prorocentrum cordatum TaxID=2364126 RepID=A0ABN9VCX9_9DINO|nr:unnamed protein product [Polarella glacialis]